MEKGMHVRVYRSDMNCTNGGISSKYSTLTLIGEGVPELFAPSEKSPAIYLKHDYNGVPGNTVAQTSLTDGKWYMFGGNFIYHSDSRFPSDHPIKVMDRTETQEQYDMLSR